jgi:flavodoxin
LKALVIFDSQYGNTAAIADVIGSELSATVLEVTNASPADCRGVDLLIVGSPTQGGRPTVAIQAFLKKISSGSLRGTAVAAFDTRFASDAQGIALRLLMKVIGYAAARISKALVAKGGAAAGQPEGFIVVDKEGPLGDGELERARQWAMTLSQAVAASSPPAAGDTRSLR